MGELDETWTPGTLLAMGELHFGSEDMVVAAKYSAHVQRPMSDNYARGVRAACRGV
jgi:hypothetical protein